MSDVEAMALTHDVTYVMGRVASYERAYNTMCLPTLIINMSADLYDVDNHKSHTIWYQLMIVVIVLKQNNIETAAYCLTEHLTA